MAVKDVPKRCMPELRSRPVVGSFWRLRSPFVTCMQREGILLDAGTRSGCVRLTERI